jgi:hypothetical protein
MMNKNNITTDRTKVNTELNPMRRKDWSSRWVRFITDSRALGADLSLDWESMNCLKWACMGIEEMTAFNPYEHFAPEDGSLKDVVKTIRNRGYKTMDQIIESRYPEVPIGLAQLGDLVLVESNWEEMDVDTGVRSVMPFGAALADPPHYWCVLPEGLSKGELYVHGHRAFAVGRIV